MTIDDYIQIFLLGIGGGFTSSVIFSLMGFTFYKLLKMIERG